MLAICSFFFVSLSLNSWVLPISFVNLNHGMPAVWCHLSWNQYQQWPAYRHVYIIAYLLTCMHAYIDWMDGWMNGWMGACMDGWMDG